MPDAGNAPAGVARYQPHGGRAQELLQALLQASASAALRLGAAAQRRGPHIVRRGRVRRGLRASDAAGVLRARQRRLPRRAARPCGRPQPLALLRRTLEQETALGAPARRCRVVSAGRCGTLVHTCSRVFPPQSFPRTRLISSPAGGLLSLAEIDALIGAHPQQMRNGLGLKFAMNGQIVGQHLGAHATPRPYYFVARFPRGKLVSDRDAQGTARSSASMQRTRASHAAPQSLSTRLSGSTRPSLPWPEPLRESSGCLLRQTCTYPRPYVLPLCLCLCPCLPLCVRLTLCRCASLRVSVPVSCVCASVLHMCWPEQVPHTANDARVRPSLRPRGHCHPAALRIQDLADLVAVRVACGHAFALSD